jgi:hypothetical protein
MTRTLSPAFAIANTLFLWLAIAVASIALWPIYQDLWFVVVVAATTVAGSAIALAGARFRWPTAIVVLAGLGVYLVLGVPLAVPAEATNGIVPTLEGERQLLVSTALGWKQLLTVTLPVGTYQALLVPLFLLVLLASVAGLSTALRAKAGDLATIAPVVLLIAGIVFGPDYARWPRTVAIALIAVLLTWVVWRRVYRRRAAIAALTAATTDVGPAPAAVASDHRIFGLRTVASGIAILAVAGAASIAATSALPPAGARQVLRSAIVQPFDPRDYASPLVGYRNYLEPDETDDTILTATGLPDGAFLRIATLDSYDGIVYSVGSAAVDSASGSFTRVPYRFDQSTLDGTDVTIDVTVGDYSGVWVPTVGKLESVDFSSSTLRDSFYYNDNSGTAAVVGGLASGDEYSLTARVPVQPTADELGTLTAGSAAVPSVTNLPQDLEVALSGYVVNASGQGAQLVAMLAGLQRDGYVSHGSTTDDETPSRSGHSADRITELLTDQRMIGDAEQYAVTAALMARQLGFPARVVYGFAPDVAAAGPTVVTGSSITAWIEVDTAQYGWVAIDPNPAVRPIPAENPEDPTVVSRPPSIVEPPEDTPSTTDEQTPPESTQADPEESPAWIGIVLLALRIFAWVVVIGGILLSPFIAIIAAKARRRRRRKRGATALDRISGGWWEYRDAVLDHGFVPPPSATRSEVAETAGGAQAAVLAAVADRAVFAPQSTDDDEAEKVWRAVEELRMSLDRGMTRWERIKVAVSLRSMGSTRLVRYLLSRGTPK